MKEGFIILNFDESAISLTTSKYYSWSARKSPTNICISKRISGLSILVAVSLMGDIFFQYLNGNNNETSVASFFIMLAEELSNVREDWRTNYVLVLDNCSCHKTPMVRQVLRNIGFKVLYTAPASYLAMPVELVFGRIKQN